MGKITVKHYLNKKLKPIEIEDKKLYPVYIRIIYNQFSTEKKSESDIWLTEYSYDTYSKNGKPLENELSMFVYNIGKRSIEKEIAFIYSGINLIDEYEIKVDRKSLLRLVDKLSVEVSSLITQMYFFNLYVYIQMGKENEENYNTEYEEFLSSFHERNILDMMDDIHQYTGVELKKYLKEETLIDMEALRIVSKIASEKVNVMKYANTYLSFSEFACMDYKHEVKKIIGDKTIDYSNKIIEAIEKLIDYSVEYACNTEGVKY